MTMAGPRVVVIGAAAHVFPLHINGLRAVDARADVGGRRLLERLKQLEPIAGVGHVRGQGLMAAVEVVADKATRERYPPELGLADRLVAAMLTTNRPVTCVNFAAAPHAFELFHDTLETREVIRQMMRFARFHLASTAADGVYV